VKEFLSRRGVPYRTRPIAEDGNLERLAARNPTLRTAPVTYVGEVEIVGWDARALTSALIDAGFDATERRAGAAFPELARGAGLPTSPRWLLVTSFVESAIASIPVDGERHGGLADRTRALPGRAIAAAHVPSTGVIGVVGCDSGLVTWLRAADGTPLRDTTAASSVPVGEAPLDAVADPHEPLVYVSVSEDRRVVVLHPSGQPGADDVVRASVPTRNRPGVLAFSRTRDMLFVRQREGGTLVFRGEDIRRDPSRARPLVVPTPPGRGLALAADDRALVLPHPFGEPDSLCIYDLDASLAASGPHPRVVPTGAMPFGIAAHPAAPIVYVSCFQPPVLELREASTGEYVTGSAEASVVSLPSAARAMVVDPQTDTLYVSCFDASVVLALDARTGARRSPASWETAAGPRGMALITAGAVSGALPK
jgi:hypothetical protein